VAAGFNLCDVTVGGVLEQEEGRHLWSTAVESAAVASCQEEAVVEVYLVREARQVKAQCRGLSSVTTGAVNYETLERSQF
jgi:hypothetical protein